MNAHGASRHLIHRGRQGAGRNRPRVVVCARVPAAGDATKLGTNPIEISMAAVLTALALLLGACSPAATKGTMPPAAQDGQVDPSAAPDFIAVAGDDGGIAGYVPKAYLFPEHVDAGRAEDIDWPVFGEDLRTLIGHMVPGRGFVALGVDPATVPTFAVRTGPSLAAPPGVSTSLTLYVRNGTTQQAWFAVHPEGASGYNHGLGVGCFNPVAGEALVMLDRAPQDADAQILRTIHRRTEAKEGLTLWVDIGSDGAISQGQGVPAWWVGDPQVC